MNIFRKVYDIVGLRIYRQIIMARWELYKFGVDNDSSIK